MTMAVGNVTITRAWAMPNRWTFTIAPIRALILRYADDGAGWIDPFAGRSELAEYRNDLDPASPCESHLPADEFCRGLSGGHGGILFDPPYSGRQVRECYTHLGRKVHRDDTNAYFFANVKRAASPKIRSGGHAICCGWNSNGFGRRYGFELIEVLMVAHGSSHNDTIVTVERKIGP